MIPLTSLIFISEGTSVWKAYLQSWLESMNQTHGLLGRLLTPSDGGMVAAALNVVCTECELMATVTLLAMVQSMCRILASLLTAFSQAEGSVSVRGAGTPHREAADRERDVSFLILCAVEILSHCA